ncbi:MAG TPA: hypothetical protein VNI84_13680 [Pyrinomonadaceae bacterium]|nr:hypothetical protein [Pyrinomonadaceae bacterium]
MDEKTAEFYVRVRRAYLTIAKREPERFSVLSQPARPAKFTREQWKLLKDFWVKK